MIRPILRRLRQPEPRPPLQKASRSQQPRAEVRHAPSLSSVRVELEDGAGEWHSGQLWNISASGAALCFSRSHLSLVAGLVTSLRILSRTGSDNLALPVEVRWIDLDHGAWFVGVRFADSLVNSSFLQDLLVA